MKRLIPLIVALFVVPAWAATVEFGWHPGSHGTAGDIATNTHANVGWLNKGLVYFAMPNDTLDSVAIWANSGDGTAESVRVYLYTLTGDLGTLGTRVKMDTMGPITNTGAARYAISFNQVLTAKTWYALAVDTFTATAGGFISRHFSTTGTAGTMVPQTAGEDGETKAAPGASPWGSEGTNNTNFMELWGVVKTTAVASGRHPVTFVSKWDTTSGTGTNDSMICKWPTGMQAGDVQIAMIMKGDDLAGSSLTEKAGWNVIHEASSTTTDDQMVGIYWRVCTGANNNSDSIFVFGAAETFSGGITAWRDVDTSAILDCSPFTNWIANPANDDPVNRSVTTRTDSAMAIIFATSSRDDSSSAITTPSGFSNLWTRKAGNGTTAFNGSMAAYKLITAAGAVGDQTWDVVDTNTSTCATVTLALRPRAAAATSASTLIMISDGE